MRCFSTKVFLNKLNLPWYENWRHDFKSNFFYFSHLRVTTVLNHPIKCCHSVVVFTVLLAMGSKLSHFCKKAHRSKVVRLRCFKQKSKKHIYVNCLKLFELPLKHSAPEKSFFMVFSVVFVKGTAVEDTVVSGRAFSFSGITVNAIGSSLSAAFESEIFGKAGFEQSLFLWMSRSYIKPNTLHNLFLWWSENTMYRRTVFNWWKLKKKIFWNK